MRIRLLLAAAILLIFSACEDNMFLKSEKKMKEDIQGSWLRNFQGRNPYITNCPAAGDTIYLREIWTFSDNVIHTTFEYDPQRPCDRGTPDQNLNDVSDTVVVSGFKIDTRMFKAYLKFQVQSGVNDSVVTFPDKWEFVTLDDKVLYLAADDPKGTSVLQLEFSKIK